MRCHQKTCKKKLSSVMEKEILKENQFKRKFKKMEIKYNELPTNR